MLKPHVPEGTRVFPGDVIATIQVPLGMEKPETARPFAVSAIPELAGRGGAATRPARHAIARPIGRRYVGRDAL